MLRLVEPARADALPYLTVAIAAHAIDARTRVYEGDLGVENAQRLDTRRSAEGGFTVRAEVPFHEANREDEAR